jgi:4-hydroxyphenylacetate 3-monooxygenase
MTRTGEQYVKGLRDGRRVYLDGELAGDVTSHPAFRGAVESVARLYDAAADPAAQELMTFESPRTGERVNRAFMIARSEQDLVLRRRALQHWSECSYGLLGRGPDHVSGFLAGFASRPDVFARGGQHFADNVVRFYEDARDNDWYVTYVIAPPQIDRSKPAHQQEDPFLYAGVSAERDDGVLIRGAQMLGTGVVLSDYLLLSCIVPLRPGDEAYAISVAIPVGAPGVKVYSRRSYAAAASSVFDYPLSSRFDETDSLLVFDEVFVPWERVFVYRNLELVSAQWTQTPAHLLGNNQAQIRFSTKLDFLTALALRVAQMNGSASLPPVKGALGEIAAYASMVRGLVAGQEQNCRIDEYGVAWPGAAECYANMTLQSRIYPMLLDMVRDLCGGGLIQLPSSVKDFANPQIAADLHRYVQSPGTPSDQRVKLLKLVWDLIGSEFGSRHHQYEMFYAGAPFVTKMRMFDMYDFSRGERLVDHALASYTLDSAS